MAEATSFTPRGKAGLALEGSAVAAVVEALARDAGLHAMLVADKKPDAPLVRSDWVLVSARQSELLRPTIAAAAAQPPVIEGLRPWTDDASNLFRVLK
jgi:hypothetical protein